MVKVLRPKPTFFEEQLLWQQGIHHVAGVDEVGRGCFAGPVVAGAVIFPPQHVFSHPILRDIDDSKKLSPVKRTLLSKYIEQEALAIGIGVIEVEEINKKGIAQATQDAFSQAILNLNTIPSFILSDAFFIRDFKREIQKPIIKGDSLSISIAAASIVAKVYRDQLMDELDKEVPQYNFKTNKGYGTTAHRLALSEHGLSIHHRLSFSLHKYLHN